MFNNGIFVIPGPLQDVENVVDDYEVLVGDLGHATRAKICVDFWETRIERLQSVPEWHHGV